MSEAHAYPEPVEPNIESLEDEEQFSLAKVLNLPVVENTSIDSTLADHNETASSLPTTTLDTHQVREILSSEQFKGPDDRIANLLVYAWNSTSPITRTIPGELLPYATDNPVDWYQEHRQKIADLLEERSGIQPIYDATDPYDSSPFLRNASSINEMAWGRGMGYEAIRTELAARMIVLEAVQARDRGQKS